MATIAQHIATAEQGLEDLRGTAESREFFARYINVSIRSSRSTRAINKYLEAAKKHGFAISYGPGGSGVIEVVDEVNK